MSTGQKERLQTVVDLVDKMAVDPDVNIDYFIPGFLVTAKGGREETGGPFVEFSYSADGQEPHIQHMPLRQRYLDKTPEDLANLITFSLEQFMGEIDSRQYGAQ
jgi:hypothetical protein